MISPLLSNIFLHEVLDKWFAEQIKPRLQGRCFLIRYADDFIMGFEYRRDAARVLEVLWKRFARFGLELHPEKTRIVPFRRPGKGKDKKDKRGSQSFDFLAFTHYWGKSLKGTWIVKKKTAKDRLCRSLKAINRWCRKNRHLKLRVQQAALRQKMLGHYAYFGVTGNSRSLHKYAEGVRHYWHKWLRRRHRQRNDWDWEWYERTIVDNYPLPQPRIVHSVYHRANP